MNSPLVSVIMPVYNASKYVEEAVASVLNQTYQNFELLVIDDGSKDNSLELIKSFDDPRLHVFTQMNQGANVARNRGLYESKGEYVKFLDSDDVLYPDALKTQVEQMASLADNEEVFGDFDFIDENGKVFYHHVLDEELLQKLMDSQDQWMFRYWYMVTTCPLHRRKNLLQVGGFDVSLRGHQERMLHVTMSLTGVKFVYRPGAIYGYRSYIADNRLSCARLANTSKLTETVYVLDSIYELIEAKYGKKYNVMSTAVSDRYFIYADKFFKAGKVAEGRYCLSRCMAIPHYRKHPRYYNKFWAAVMYLCLGKVFGFKRAAVWMDKLSVVMGIKLEGDFKANMIFRNPFESEKNEC